MAELKINWERLTKGPFRDKEIRWLRIQIAASTLRASSQ